MKIFNAAVIGCGNIFPTHGVSIELCERARLVAVCDIDEDRAQEMARRHSCSAYTDWRRMLESEQIDTVHICLPHHLHASVAMECMKRGKSVITEKPMAICVNDGEAMMRCARENGVRLACIFQNRFNAGTQLVRRMYQSGELGRVKGAKCSVTWCRGTDYYRPGDWHGTWDKEGGGVIINQAIHTLDAMRYVMDSRPVEVYATIANRGDVPIEVEDSAEGAILFENGVRANFHAISYYSFDDEVRIDLDFERARASIVSDRASVTMFDGRSFIAERDPRQSVEYGDVKSYWGVNHSRQISDFYECLETGKPFFVDLEGAFETLKMVSAIYESAKSGKKVVLE
jgi:predicted dehydrogenase